MRRVRRHQDRPQRGHRRVPRAGHRLAGKILRLNPDTGQGYPSNPYWDGNASSVRSRVWLYGLRNPYRFCLKPGTGGTDPAAGTPGTLYIGDVGWKTYEETNIAKVKGLNFGWPCYEGFGANSEYQAGAPAHNGCGSFGTATNPASQSAPSASWHHGNDNLSSPTGFHGNTSIGGVFYGSNKYPASIATSTSSPTTAGGRGRGDDANDNLVRCWASEPTWTGR